MVLLNRTSGAKKHGKGFFVKQISQLEIRSALAAGQVRLPGGGRQVKKTGAVRSSFDPEEELHRACHSWNELQLKRYPFLEWIFHSPNGGKRSASEAGRFKAMGVKAGVPDFMLPFPAARWTGLAIELKSPVGTLSVNQKKWLQRAHQAGWVIGVARTLDQYIELVRSYLDGTEYRGFSGYIEIFK
jgi:hypothetical protein